MVQSVHMFGFKLAYVLVTVDHAVRLRTDHCLCSYVIINGGLSAFLVQRVIQAWWANNPYCDVNNGGYLWMNG